MTDGCSCHINPPCGWCLSLTEEEWEIYDRDGSDAVQKHRDRLDEELIENAKQEGPPMDLEDFTKGISDGST